MSYRVKAFPRAAMQDQARQLTGCEISVSDSLIEKEGEVFEQIAAGFVKKKISDKTFSIITIRDIYENKGASLLDFVTALTLGFFPAFRFDDSAYLVSVKQENQFHIREAEFEIVSDLVVWTPTIFLAWWPKSNKDRLRARLTYILSNYCQNNSENP